jgi:hypothetical protein
MLEERGVKGVTFSEFCFPVDCGFAAFPKLLRTAAGEAGEVDEASLPRGVRMLREMTPGIVLAVS